MWLLAFVGCGDDLAARFRAIEEREPAVGVAAPEPSPEPTPAEEPPVEEPPTDAPPAEAPPDAVPVPDVVWPVTVVDDTHRVVDPVPFLALVDALPSYQLGRAVPHRGPDGELDGVRLSGIRREGPGDALGLKNGDVVHTLDGVPVRGQEDPAMLRALVTAGRPVRAELVRRGTALVLEWTPR